MFVGVGVLRGIGAIAACLLLPCAQAQDAAAGAQAEVRGYFARMPSPVLATYVVMPLGWEQYGGPDLKALRQAGCQYRASSPLAMDSLALVLRQAGFTFPALSSRGFTPRRAVFLTHADGSETVLQLGAGALDGVALPAALTRPAQRGASLFAATPVLVSHLNAWAAMADRTDGRPECKRALASTEQVARQ